MIHFLELDELRTEARIGDLPRVVENDQRMRRLTAEAFELLEHDNHWLRRELERTERINGALEREKRMVSDDLRMAQLRASELETEHKQLREDLKWAREQIADLKAKLARAGGVTC